MRPSPLIVLKAELGDLFDRRLDSRSRLMIRESEY